MKRLRQIVALALSGCMAGFAQQTSLGPIERAGITRWYSAPEIPGVRLSNSARLQNLLQGGKLYLTAQDAIALALENNIDVESNRYNALVYRWNYVRSQAGGALPGVPSGSSSAGSVQSGQGVAGSQQAAGVTNSGNSSSGGNGTNATISQIGPVTPTLDPTFQSVNVFSHRSSPQSNSTQSQTENLITNTRSYQESLASGFITGGKATLSFSNSYLNENAPSDLLNPSNGTTLQLSMQHNLLYGFGKALNARNITIAKANIGINDLTFETQVISVVVSVLQAYYTLVADIAAVKADQEAVTVAQHFFDDNKKQVQIGTMAPLDVTTAEAQLATSQQNLVVAQTGLEQQAVTLKNLISRNGLADPLIANAEIVPLDKIEVPATDTLPSVKEAVSIAMTNRIDLKINDLNMVNSKTSAMGTANGVLPQLVGFATLRQQGQSGVGRTVYQGEYPGTGPVNIPAGYIACPAGIGGPRGVCQNPDSFFVGGIGTALGQMIRRDFPSESGGVFGGVAMRNRQARADQAIDVLSMRQVELQNQRTMNQVTVDAQNQLISLQQARVKYLAAAKNRVLNEQLLDAEQKKFSLGASTTFNVVTQQRDLATAQSTEVSALVAYSNAKILLDQTLGTTLKSNNIAIDEVQKGQLSRTSTPPK